jgi:ABC-type antimicrobial peptide transport system permease subunit
VFGHPTDSFVLERFQMKEGIRIDDREASKVRGKPIMIGSVAAESFEKGVGDTFRLGSGAYRIIGIYETGDAFEDGGIVVDLKEAQELLGKPRQVSLFYIRLRDIALADRVIERSTRLWSDYEMVSTEDYADQQLMGDVLRGFVWSIAGLAILIGGVGMMNAQLMAVMERTREIGVLRAVGWSKGRVLRMILNESIFVSILGGALGIGLGWLLLYAMRDLAGVLGATTEIRPGILLQAAIVVVVMGFVGGVYPAWRASNLAPVEALRYEGGSSSTARRLPIGGMAAQSLWQRTARTLLTLSVIGLTVGSIMAMEGVIGGVTEVIGNIALGGDAEILIRQADIADTSLSAIDERVGKKIAAMPEVQSISGMAMTAMMDPENGSFFLVLGYAPGELAIRQFNIIEGERVTTNHQVMLGKSVAETMKKGVGDTLEIAGNRFRVVGIYDAGGSWEELGGVITLRDAQTMMGRQRKVTMYIVNLHDPGQAEAVVESINTQYPEAYAALSGEFAEQMPDMQTTDAMVSGISILAVLVGGVGVMNTMLMAVMERTREIGVMRALGWRRRKVLGLILREALLLGLLGGAMGVVIAFSLAWMMGQIPQMGDVLTPVWELQAFLRAFVIALSLGVVGGLYPALRATRLEPIEALRYE